MLSHIDDNNQPAMVDVSGKAVTHRSAHARARVILPPVVRAAFVEGEIRTPKGPVFQTAIIAGTMAAKRTHELIPFCHPIGLDSCRIEIELGPPDTCSSCTTRVEHRTGVEMEALTGASVAAHNLRHVQGAFPRYCHTEIRPLPRRVARPISAPTVLPHESAGPADCSPVARVAHGRDKAALLIDGRTLLARSVALLRP